MLGWEPKDSNASMFEKTYDWYVQNRDKADATTGTTHRKTVSQGILKVIRNLS
jgi:dTDP-D-glucose 4,6-dehydratase